MLTRLTSIVGDLAVIQDVERKLLNRKRQARFSMVLAIGWAIIQVLIGLSENESLQRIESLALYQIIAILLFVITLGAYFLLTYTGFLLKESKEPFRYTFWIKEFTRIANTPVDRFQLEGDDRLFLLHHDLMERLNYRIRRLSLLEIGPSQMSETPEDSRQVQSHIHIEGHYALRETKNGWVIHIMPRVRIGDESMASHLAQPVKFDVAPLKPGENLKKSLEPDKYSRIVERVYSSIATEIYRQIKADIAKKIALFPTRYLQVSALLHEAEDFERSNTIDSYDHAIELYEDAVRRFDASQTKHITERIFKSSRLWYLLGYFPIQASLVNTLLMEARLRTGFARSMVFRRIISALSGRQQNPIFEARHELKTVIAMLSTLHNRIITKDEWLLDLNQPLPEDRRESIDAQEEKDYQYRLLLGTLTFPKESRPREQKHFEANKKALFDAYLVAALVYARLGAVETARCYHERAKAIAPDLSERSALWMFVAGEIQPDLTGALLFFGQAAEIAADLEIALYQLAYTSDMNLRQQLIGEIQHNRIAIDTVIDEYERVLEINSGNLGALVAQGYLLWLFKDYEEARRKFEEGLEIKATIRQSFIGDLAYGLARIAAAQGNFKSSYEHFTQAMAADPGVGAYIPTIEILQHHPYYEFIEYTLLERYRGYKEKVKTEIDAQKARNEVGDYSKEEPRHESDSSNVPDHILDAVYSFVLNDFGNACFNYWFRLGNANLLREAALAYEEACNLYRQNPVAHYNFAIAKQWEGGPNEQARQSLEYAMRLAPAWPAVNTSLARIILQTSKDEIKKIDSEIPQIDKSIGDKQSQISAQRSRIPSSRLADKAKQTSSQVYPPEPSGGSQKQTLVRTTEQDNLNEEIRRLEDEIIDLTNQKLQHGEKRVELIRMVHEETRDLLRQSRLSILFSRIQEGSTKETFEPTNRLQSGFFSRVMRKLFRQMKPSVQHEGTSKAELADIIPQEVAGLLSAQIRPDDLDQTDVAALMLWADICTMDNTNERAINAAKDLYLFIQRNYYPEQLDIVLAFLDLKYQEPRYRGQLERTIRYWLDGDPTHYYALSGWARQYLKGEEYIERLKTATEKRSGSDVLQNLLGNSYFEQGKYKSARNCYEKAIEITPKCDVYHSNLSLAWAALKESVDKNEALNNSIAALNHAIELNHQKEDYRNRLEKLKVERVYGARVLDRRPELIPIAVEIAVDLISKVEDSESGGLNQTVQDLVNKMRIEIKNSMGVQVPGIRFRFNEDLPLSTYTVVINDVPLARENLSEKRLFRGRAKDLQPLGIRVDGTTSPFTGVWVSSADWEKVNAAGLELPDEIQSMMLHVQAVLRSNMGHFLGHQEVYDLLPKNADTLRQDPMRLATLTTVLRRMLVEGIPITRIERIVERFEQLYHLGQDVLLIVEEIRSLPEVQRNLPGNNAEYTHFHLSKRYETQFNQSLVNNALIMKPEDIQNALTFIRESEQINKTLDAGQSVALIVEDVLLRGYIRQIMELEFPYIPVLSEEELLPDLKGKIAGEIDWFAGDEG